MHASFYFSRFLTLAILQNATWAGACEIRAKVCSLVSHYLVEEYQRGRGVCPISLQVLSHTLFYY